MELPEAEIFDLWERHGIAVEIVLGWTDPVPVIL